MSHSHSGQPQLLVSGSGFGCLSNGAANDRPVTTLTYDVSGLGWKSARWTDLWTGKVHEGPSISSGVSGGDGASQVWRLTRLS